MVEVEVELVHEGMSLTARRIAALTDEFGADRERDLEVDVELLVDRERERLGHALERAGEHDRRPKLADSACERERPAAAEASSRERKRDRKNVRPGPAPSVRAAPVSEASTASKAEIRREGKTGSRRKSPP